MRRLIILCVILLGESGSRAQLNYEGNPLTDNTEYTAEESHVSGRNARRDYQRFEVADGRTAGTTRGGPFSPSPRDDVAAAGADFSRNYSNANAAPVASKTTVALSPLENDLTADVGKPQSAANNDKSASESHSNERSESDPSGSEAPTALQSSPEARQLREYSVHSSYPMSSYPSQQDAYQTYAQPEMYDQSPRAAQLTNLAAPATLATSQALTEFLNSRTPEESQMALQNYLAIRERAAAVQNGAQSAIATDAVIPGQNAIAEQNSNAVSSNGYSTDEYLQRQEVANAQRLQQSSSVGAATKVVQDRTGQASYSPGLPYPPQRLSHRLDWQQQQQRPFGPARQQRPRYRGQTGRLRGRPWAQSRVDPRGPFYHPGGPVYSGPPPPPGPPAHPAGFGLGKWKQSPPVEVIYTRPPGFAHPPPDSPGPHEDASHWFPEASHPPPQKDVYYSQLYAQSYDPHYYNYIAKTGKIKPWLYGKLGKHEEKSIWWELFTGFKKHGMKNMMNPMFLLGMTIPTLTIMLTALVQKRSLLARADNGGRLTEQMIDEYAQRLRDYIECHERRIKEEDGKDKKCW